MLNDPTLALTAVDNIPLKVTIINDSIAPTIPFLYVKNNNPIYNIKTIGDIIKLPKNNKIHMR